MDRNYKFYVIDDLNKNRFDLKYFDAPNFEDAFASFVSQECQNRELPAIGISGPGFSLDMVHRVNGENVLVTDYRMKEVNSDGFNAVYSEIDEIVNKLVDTGIVKYEYSKAIKLPDARVIVPVSERVGEYENGYCDDKILKTTTVFGLDSINSAFIERHGWVGFEELCNKSYQYAEKGYITIGMLNVNYVTQKSLTGIDGQMDIKPCDFVRLLDKINKSFYISVFDEKLYGRRNSSNYIVASYDTLAEAVKAWYFVNGKVQYRPGVIDRSDYSNVFNGFDHDLNPVSYEKASEIYGFDKKDDVDKIIDDALKVSKASGNKDVFKEEVDLEKE